MNSRLGTHLIAASSLWRQLWNVAEGHEKMESSEPVHCRSSKWMGPVPTPKVLIGPLIAVLSGIRKVKGYSNSCRVVQWVLEINYIHKTHSIQRIQPACRPRWRRSYPRGHRRPFPTPRSCRPPHVLPTQQCHQWIWWHHSHTLEQSRKGSTLNNGAEIQAL